MAFEVGSLEDFGHRIDAESSYKEFRTITENDVKQWLGCRRWPLGMEYVDGLALCKCEPFPEYGRTYALPLLMFNLNERHAREAGIRRGWFDRYLTCENPADYVLDIRDSKMRRQDGTYPFEAVISMRLQEWQLYARAVTAESSDYPIAGFDPPGDRPPLNLLFMPLQRINA